MIFRNSKQKFVEKSLLPEWKIYIYVFQHTMEEG